MEWRFLSAIMCTWDRRKREDDEVQLFLVDGDSNSSDRLSEQVTSCGWEWAWLVLVKFPLLQSPANCILHRESEGTGPKETTQTACGQNRMLDQFHEALCVHGAPRWEPALLVVRR